ncbi:hypothetical protein [Kutzneria sp. 744]|uniref:hypothetical protein n=1 Tax=Kutzneria sp. (strain 744) TaxID=345341 RepID=UPI0003EEDF91|nr:hypothetical protein [Kutzneria sp. 744]EWM19623.1 hypothetical protein KUTG_09927 [Kutzneria sp. 744]
MPPQNNDYPYVRAWGDLMGSYSYFINDQVMRARADGAPANATHRRHDGTWATTDDILRSDTRRQLGLDPLPPREPDALDLMHRVIDAIGHRGDLIDLYGLIRVRADNQESAVVEFSTGWSARLQVSLTPPTTPR